MVALTIVKCRDVQSELARGRDQRLDGGLCCVEPFLRDDAITDGRFTALPGDGLEVIGGDPAALGDDALDRAVGARLRSRQNGSDIEHLTASYRFVATRLAQDEPVARCQWDGAGQMDAHRGVAARLDGILAEHP